MKWHGLLIFFFSSFYVHCFYLLLLYLLFCFYIASLHMPDLIISIRVKESESEIGGFILSLLLSTDVSGCLFAAFFSLS